MRGKIGDKVRLQHILDAIIEIETYTLNTDFSDFSKNSMMKFACINKWKLLERQAITFQMKIKQKFLLLNGLS